MKKFSVEEFINLLVGKYGVFLTVLIFVGALTLLILATLCFLGLQRRFSSETLAHGYMDEEQGHEIAPTVFSGKPTSESPHHKDDSSGFHGQD